MRHPLWIARNLLQFPSVLGEILHGCKKIARIMRGSRITKARQKVFTFDTICEAGSLGHASKNGTQFRL
jgi:hypothetical protein